MGHGQSVESATHNGRLSQDEASALLTTFDFRESRLRGLHRSKSGFVSDLSVANFVSRFPPPMQPFVAAVLPELTLRHREKVKTGGKMTMNYLIMIGKLGTLLWDTLLWDTLLIHLFFLF